MSSGEDKVIAMYAQYKHSRDVINPDVYFHLREEASDILAGENHEHEIQQLTKLAGNFLESGLAKTPVTEEVDKRKHFFAQLRHLVATSFSLPLPKLASGFAAIAVLAATILWFAPTADRPSDYYVVDTGGTGISVADIVQSDFQWQYGFTSQKVRSAAYLAGEIVVDLSNVDDSQRQDLYVRAVELFAQSKAGNEDVDFTRSTDAEDVDWSFKQLFSDSKEMAVYEYGKWIEYHYLLAKVAVRSGNVSLYQNSKKPLSVQVIAGQEALGETALYDSKSDQLNLADLADREIESVRDLENVLSQLNKLKLLNKFG